jgi:hypothetical protein
MPLSNMSLKMYSIVVVHVASDLFRSGTSRMYLILSLEGRKFLVRVVYAAVGLVIDKQ